MSKREVRIRLKDADEQSRELAVEFARNFDDLSAEDTDAIRKIFGEPPGSRQLKSEHTRNCGTTA